MARLRPPRCPFEDASDLRQVAPESWMIRSRRSRTRRHKGLRWRRPIWQLVRELAQDAISAVWVAGLSILFPIDAMRWSSPTGPVAGTQSKIQSLHDSQDPCEPLSRSWGVWWWPAWLAPHPRDILGIQECEAADDTQQQHTRRQLDYPLPQGRWYFLPVARRQWQRVSRQQLLAPWRRPTELAVSPLEKFWALEPKDLVARALPVLIRTKFLCASQQPSPGGARKTIFLLTFKNRWVSPWAFDETIGQTETGARGTVTSVVMCWKPNCSTITFNSSCGATTIRPKIDVPWTPKKKTLMETERLH